MRVLFSGWLSESKCYGSWILSEFELEIYICFAILMFDCCLKHSFKTHFLHMQSEGAYDQIEKEARRVAQGLGAEYWAVSSKTGDNVEALFLRVAALTFDHSVMQELTTGSSDRRKHSTVSKYLSSV